MNADLAQVGATCPGWRAWRTRDGLAARKGGTPPGVQARGATLRELTANIAAIETAAAEDGGSSVLRPNYRAILTALGGAAGPLTSRAVSDASGLALSTTVHSLGILCAWGVTERHRDGRTWLGYAPPSHWWNVPALRPFRWRASAGQRRGSDGG